MGSVRLCYPLHGVDLTCAIPGCYSRVFYHQLAFANRNFCLFFFVWLHFFASFHHPIEK